ncbi:MAG: glycosyltransferase, partial [Tannerella sp.]|nr:glycosyltransferase [Tannerella sp.]
MKRKIYLFNQVSKATNYGIGRYIEQIVNLVKNTDMILTIVELYSKNAKEVSVTKERYGNRIAIPFVSTSSSFHTEKADGRYARNVAYLLKEYIPDNEDCLFHLNYMESEHLPIELKKQFKAKILLTVHYTNWSFSLLGDKVRLRKIVNANKEESTESDAEFIRKSVEKDRQIIEQCDRILCIAQHSYNNVREIYHADKSKLVLVYNGLEDGYQKLSPTRIQRLKKQYYIRPDEKIILFAGRLDEVKAVSYLIKSFQLLLQDRDDIRLIIAGDGDYTQLFPATKEIWTKVTFTGYIQKKEL